jgi:HK97 gp10 family phage protein
MFRRKVLTKRANEIAGLPELFNQLNDLGDAVEEDDVYKVLMHGAFVLRDEAKDLAPYDPKRKKGTHLRDAIFATEGDPSKDPRGPNVIAGVNKKLAPHAGLVERGTSKMPARPYWRPAVNATRPAIAEILAGGIRDIIAKVTG